MLLQVVTEFKDEVSEIRRVFTEETAPSSVACRIMPYCPLDDGCLVALWDSWARFMRSLYLTCAQGTSTGVSGARYNPRSPIGEAQALALLRLTASVKGSGITLASGEPKWFVTSSVQAIATCLGLANGRAISNAVSQADIQLGGGFVIPNPLEHIRRVRNYVAHKSVAEAAWLRAFMTPSAAHVSGHLREKTRGGATRFDDWSDALVDLAWSAAL